MVEYLIAFCNRIKDHGSVKYIGIFSAMSVTLSYLADRVMSSYSLSDRPDVENLPAPILFALTVIMAPLIETFLFQFCPVILAKHFNFSRLVQFFAASIPFALAHFASNLASGLSAGVIGGTICGFTFVVWSDNSNRSAFWVTASVHSLHNLAFFLFFLFVPLGVGTAGELPIRHSHPHRGPDLDNVVHTDYPQKSQTTQDALTSIRQGHNPRIIALARISR